MTRLTWPQRLVLLAGIIIMAVGLAKTRCGTEIEATNGGILAESDLQGKGKEMKGYKLTDQDCYTRRGQEREILWEFGVRHEITKEGAELGTDQVFHFYPSPEMAAFANPIGANILNPRCFEVEAEDVVADNGTRMGCKAMTRGEEVALPRLTLEQRVEIGIRCVLTVNTEPDFRAWAEDWLSRKDRSAAAAGVVAVVATSLATSTAAFAAANGAAGIAYAAVHGSASAASIAATSGAYATGVLDVDAIIKAVLGSSEKGEGDDH